MSFVSSGLVVNHIAIFFPHPQKKKKFRSLSPGVLVLSKQLHGIESSYFNEICFHLSLSGLIACRDFVPRGCAGCMLARLEAQEWSVLRTGTSKWFTFLDYSERERVNGPLSEISPHEDE